MLCGRAMMAVLAPSGQVRCCDAKIPEAMRDGQPFEEVLQRWLQLVFVPTYRQLLKDKARGIVKKAI